MRDTFPGWYQPDEREVEATWKSGLIVFDASAILNLYRYDNDPRDEFFNVLGSVRERLWLPYQAAMEFQRNRINTIVKQVKMIGHLKDEIAAANKTLIDSLSDRNLLSRIPVVNTKGVRSEISQTVSKVLESLRQVEEQSSKLLDEDFIRTKVERIFDQQIGLPPEDQASLDALQTEGKKRFEQRMPPGFSDAKKGNASYVCNGLHYMNQYGDYILWEQVLSHVKSSSIRDLIFVTDDEKEDWWQIADLPGRRAFAPHPELVREYRDHTNGGTLLFLSSDSFLDEARSRLDLNISDATIGNVRENLSVSSVGIDMGAVAILLQKYLEPCYPGYEVVFSPFFPDIQIWESDQCVGYELIQYYGSGAQQLTRMLNDVYVQAEPYFKSGELSRLVIAVVVRSLEDCGVVEESFKNSRREYRPLCSVECFKPDIDESGELLRVRQLAVFDDHR